MKGKSIAIILINLLLIPCIYSSSMGTLVKNNRVKAIPGTLANFTILFWNLGDPYYLKIFPKTIPDGWLASINPEYFLLEKSVPAEPPYEDGDYINLKDIGLLKPSKVEISVKIPDKINPGTYKLSFIARSFSETGQIPILNERDFNLFIDVSGEDILEISDSNAAEIKIENKINNPNEEGSLTQNTTTTIPPKAEVQKHVLIDTLSSPSLIIILTVLVAIIGSLVIYRYA